MLTGFVLWFLDLSSFDLASSDLRKSAIDFKHQSKDGVYYLWSGFSFNTGFTMRTLSSTWDLNEDIEINLSPTRLPSCWDRCLHGRKLFSFFKKKFITFYFVLRCSWLTNNVMIVAGEQRRDSVIHIHVSLLPQTPLPSSLVHNIEQSSRCHIVGPYWLSILNTTVCICSSQTP